MVVRLAPAGLGRAAADGGPVRAHVVPSFGLFSPQAAPGPHGRCRAEEGPCALGDLHQRDAVRGGCNGELAGRRPDMSLGATLGSSSGTGCQRELPRILHPGPALVARRAPASVQDVRHLAESGRRHSLSLGHQRIAVAAHALIWLAIRAPTHPTWRMGHCAGFGGRVGANRKRAATFCCVRRQGADRYKAAL
jgi:hypothetical protein